MALSSNCLFFYRVRVQCLEKSVTENLIKKTCKCEFTAARKPLIKFLGILRRVARIFKRGGNRGYSPFTPLLSRVYQRAQSYYHGMKAHINGFYGQGIVMAFSPPDYCRLFALKKTYQGGGYGHPGTPPGYALDTTLLFLNIVYDRPKADLFLMKPC